MPRIWMLAGCVFCTLTVLLGAFGAHALKTILSADGLIIYDVATRYMMFHGLALLALGLWGSRSKRGSYFFAGCLFTTGVFLFSGSLYVLSFIKIPYIVFATPLGGLCFLAGWVCFFHSVYKTK